MAATKSARVRTHGKDQAEEAAPEKPLKPSQCRGYMRRKLADGFPEIVSGFVREAKTGSCAHMKLASELLEKTAVKKASRKKSSAELALEELRKL